MVESKKIAPVAGGVGVMMIAAAQTKPEDAISNIGGWANLLGMDGLPDLLANSHTDSWVTVFGIVLTIVAALLWWRSRSSPTVAPDQSGRSKSSVDGVQDLPSPPKSGSIQAAMAKQKADQDYHGGTASPVLDSQKGSAFACPYRKAVLQVKEIKATLMGGENGLSRISCHIDIENHAQKPLNECRVRLASVNGDVLDDARYLRIGKLRGVATESTFPVYHHTMKRINFMTRDLKDVVSNPPFMLCLDDRDLPLSDGKEYLFIFALESEYAHPTYATVRHFTPARDKIEISLVQQSLDLPDAEQ